MVCEYCQEPALVRKYVANVFSSDEDFVHCNEEAAEKCVRLTGSSLCQFFKLISRRGVEGRCPEGCG